MLNSLRSITPILVQNNQRFGNMDRLRSMPLSLKGMDRTMQGASQHDPRLLVTRIKMFRADLKVCCAGNYGANYVP